MNTIKLVVVGDSGVGKTSVRGQYISGRFSTGYRATIGADFISRTIPHPTNPDESVNLQIWDTAGQERFSSLSSAFFRGADAVLLMFDVNSRPSMESLTRWWGEFRDKAPVPDEDAAEYPCIVVGNKVDLAHPGQAVTEVEACRFLATLVDVPPDSRPPSPVSDHGSTTSHDDLPPPLSIPRRKGSLAKRSLSRSSRSIFGGTMTTTVSIYHTPSSSLFDHFESARGSYVSSRASSVRSLSVSPPRAGTPLRRMASLSMSTTSDAPTITPSIYVRHAHAHSTPHLTETRRVPRPERGAKLFFTSAKTGDGVEDVFTYAARRVLARWAYDAATLDIDDGTRSVLRLDDVHARGRTRLRAPGACCGT